MDLTQIILIIAISALTVILVLVGIEVFKVAREIRILISKFSHIIDDVEEVSGAVSKQIINFSDFLASAKTTFELAKVLFKHGDKKVQEAEKLDAQPVKEEKAEELTPSSNNHRRFFTRSGRNLAS